MSQEKLFPPLRQQSDTIIYRRTGKNSFVVIEKAKICVCGRDSAQTPLGELTALTRPLAGLRGPTSKKGEREERERGGVEKGEKKEKKMSHHYSVTQCVLLNRLFQTFADRRPCITVFRKKGIALFSTTTLVFLGRFL